MSYITPSEANKLLKRLQEEKSALELKEKQRCTFHAATVEDPETLRPEYDYEETQVELRELNRKIRKLKHAINVFNTTFVLPDFDMTIDEMLVYMPQLTSQKNKLAQMKQIPEKSRSNDYRMPNGVIDYIYTNYPVEKVSRDYDDASNYLAKAQLMLDTVNNNEKFEFE